jgi:type I restriction enzyme S subunit
MGTGNSATQATATAGNNDGLPEGWATAKVADFATKVGSGATPRGGSESYKDSGIPLIRSQNVHFDGFRDEGLVYLDNSQANALREVTVEEGDILLNITGASIGRVTQAPKRMKGARVNQHVCIIRPLNLIDSGYLARYLCSPVVQKMVMTEEYGVTRQALTKGQILDFEIPIPPAAEQTRIVAKIEALLARVNAARQRLAKVPAILKRFRQSVLAAACSGRLTADWREQADEGASGEEVLKDVLAKRRTALGERSRGRKRKYPEPVELDTCDLPEVPDEWAWASADSVCAQITDGEHIQPRYQPTGFPMLTATHIRDGYVNFDNFGLIAEADFHNCLKRCAPTEGDVLIVSVGATTGRSAIVRNCPPFAIVRSVLLLRPLIDPNYFLRWTQSRWTFNWMANASGASAQPHLYISDIKRMPVPLPPLPEQHEIVRRVEALFRLADAIQKRVAAATARAHNLTQVILAKAFRGELVPTEAELARQEAREYEPASALLERIRAGSAQGKKTASIEERKPWRRGKKIQ